MNHVYMGLWCAISTKNVHKSTRKPQNMGFSSCWAEKWLYGISINLTMQVTALCWVQIWYYLAFLSWSSKCSPRKHMGIKWLGYGGENCYQCTSARRMLSANLPCPSTSLESYGIVLSLLIKETRLFSTLFILFLVEKFWNHGSTAFLKYETKSMNPSSPTEGFSKWSRLPKGLCYTYQTGVDVAYAIKQLKWHYMPLGCGFNTRFSFSEGKHVFKTVF